MTSTTHETHLSMITAEQLRCDADDRLLVADAWNVLLGISSLSGDVVLWLLGTHTSKKTPLLRVFSPYCAALLRARIDVVSVTVRVGADMRAVIDVLLSTIERRWRLALRSTVPGWIDVPGRIVGEPAAPLRSYDFAKVDAPAHERFRCWDVLPCAWAPPRFLNACSPPRLRVALNRLLMTAKLDVEDNANEQPTQSRTDSGRFESRTVNSGDRTSSRAKPAWYQTKLADFGFTKTHDEQPTRASRSRDEQPAQLSE